MKKFFLALAAALMLFMLTPYAFSAGEGFYVGGSAGRVDARDACDGLVDVNFVGSCDSTDTGWKIFGGYQFTPNFEAEAFYADLGDTSANGTIQGLPATANVEIDGFGISAIGIFPIGDKFDVLGKLGFLRWDIKSSATVGSNSASLEANGTDIMFGIGARYSFSERFAIRVEWERFNDVGDDNIGESDVDLLSAGIVWSF